MSRTARSRSPQWQLALALPASSSGPLSFSFDIDKMELTLGGHVVKVYRFADDPEMPWFQAKPIVTFLGYSHITNTLEDHVYPEDKSALQILIKSKGSPLGGVFSQNTPLGHNELKAIHINEPALYSLIFGSRKDEAKEFKRWVCTAVLPCIRRKGFFGNFAVTLKARDDELQLALKARDDELAVTLKARDDELQLAMLARDEQSRFERAVHDRACMAQLEAALEVSLGRRDDRILSRLAQQCEQLSVCVVFAMQRSVATALQPLLLSLQPLGELLGSLKGLTSSVSMSVRGAVKDVIDAAVTSADSKLVKAFRAATKAPAKRSSADAAKFPVSQRATPKQKVEALTLAKVACEEFPRRDLHYNTWKSVKSENGKRAKAERLLRHSLPVTSPDFEPQPLLWCTGLVDGCKERYLYLEHHRAMLREVWHRKPPFGQSLHDWAVELQAAAVAEAGYVEVEWPEDVAELEVFG